MRVTIRTFATLACHAPEDGYLDLPEGSTALDVFAALDIAPEAVKILFLNGLQMPFDHPLQEQDRLGIMPAVGGG